MIQESQPDFLSPPLGALKGRGVLPGFCFCFLKLHALLDSFDLFDQLQN